VIAGPEQIVRGRLEVERKRVNQAGSTAPLFPRVQTEHGKCGQARRAGRSQTKSKSLGEQEAALSGCHIMGLVGPCAARNQQFSLCVVFGS
jgi:hypothetical protein